MVAPAQLLDFLEKEQNKHIFEITITGELSFLFFFYFLILDSSDSSDRAENAFVRIRKDTLIIPSLWEGIIPLNKEMGILLETDYDEHEDTDEDVEEW